MTIKFANIFFILLILTLITGSLNSGYVKESSEQCNKPDAGNISSSFYDDFTKDQTSSWCKSGIWSNGGIFNCEWNPEQINFSADNSLSVMTLTLDKINTNSKFPYKSGEIRSKEKYGYGLYEIKMKPVMHTGVVTSFFVYTNNCDVPGNPWDEIDIEFINSQDETNHYPVMQCNYFANGIGNNEHKIKLNFDAASSYHVYAFKWEPEKITWFIDGTIVNTTTGKNIPNHKGKIMMNLWPTINADSWAGKHDGIIPLTGYYDWVRFTPLSS
jgi:endo-1,3-1,4-beta-glycanase ExoK